MTMILEKIEAIGVKSLKNYSDAEIEADLTSLSPTSYQQ